MIATLATSVQIPGKLSFYNLVVFLHIAATVVGFGAVFAYPAFYRIGMAGDPRGLPFFHRVQEFIGSRIITVGIGVILVTGIYMASVGMFDFGDAFVIVGLVVAVLLGALGGVYFAPRERRLRELAERDVAAAGSHGEVTLSREYVDLARQVELMTFVGAGLVLMTILTMVFKPGF